MSKYEQKSIFPTLPLTTRGQFTRLSGDPKGQNILYCHRRNVYIRDIEDPTKCDQYAEHNFDPTVAVYSPSRFYICSGDKTGRIRIWDTVNPEHILKEEFHVLSGEVRDIDWTLDNGKIGVVGIGNEVKGRCITMQGNSVGTLDSGNMKAINSLAFRPQRPITAATGSEDYDVSFFTGPPFKSINQTKQGNFVNCVRFHPNGDVYISGCQDGKAAVFNGKDGELLGYLGGNQAHNGGIYALSFSPDGNEVLTVSGDKTAKIWNVATRECVVTFPMGNTVEDQQLGCLWQGEHIITVSLSGYLNYLDRNNPSQPKRILKGHNKSVTSITTSACKSSIISGGLDTKIYVWDASSGLCEDIKGKGHSSQINDMITVGDRLISIGMDDTCRYSHISMKEYESTFCKMPSQPLRLDALPNGSVVVACIAHIAIVANEMLMYEQSVKWEPKCVSVHPDGIMVAFGGSRGLHIFEYDGASLIGRPPIDTEDDVTDVKYSPDGTLLVCTTGSKRRTIVYDVINGYKHVKTNTMQTGSIRCLAWSPNSLFYATGSLDCSIVVWNLEGGYAPSVEIHIKEAHKKNHVQKVEWLSENTLVSLGDDYCIKQWDLKFKSPQVKGGK